MADKGTLWYMWQYPSIIGIELIMVKVVPVGLHQMKDSLKGSGGNPRCSDSVGSGILSPNHCVGLTTTSLPICKDAYIVAIYSRLDEVLYSEEGRGGESIQLVPYSATHEQQIKRKASPNLQYQELINFLCFRGNPGCEVNPLPTNDAYMRHELP